MNKALVFFVVLAFGACKEISFREPQPIGRKSIPSIPKKLQGQYLTFMENGDLSKDTIIISSRGYRFGYFDQSPQSNHRENYEVGLLSDSLVFKSYRGYYFLNLFQNPEWLLRVIKQEKNGDLIYMAMEQENVDFNDYVNKLSKEIRIDSIKTEKETLYHIRPSPKQLIGLIEKKFFSKTVLKRIVKNE